MNNFTYITAKEYWKLIKDYPPVKRGRTIGEIEITAKREPRTCENCDEKEWKLGGTGLCFSCTTGEADASDDYELI